VSFTISGRGSDPKTQRRWYYPKLEDSFEAEAFPPTPIIIGIWQRHFKNDPSIDH